MKTYEADGITLTLHTGTPIRVHVLYEKLPDPAGDMEAIARDRFIIAECIVQSYSFEDETHPLSRYYQERDGKTILERYELFLNLLEIKDLNTIFDAREATVHIDPPIELPDEVVTDDQKKDTLSNGSETGKKPKSVNATKIKAGT